MCLFSSPLSYKVKEKGESVEGIEGLGGMTYRVVNCDESFDKIVASIYVVIFGHGMKIEQVSVYLIDDFYTDVCTGGILFRFRKPCVMQVGHSDRGKDKEEKEEGRKKKKD